MQFDDCRTVIRGNTAFDVVFRRKTYGRLISQTVYYSLEPQGAKERREASEYPPTRYNVQNRSEN